MWRNLILLSMLATSTQADPQFKPIPMPNHVYGGGWEHFVGGGLAVFDCNNDGLPEMFAAGGENPAMLFLNRSDQGGALRFDAVTMANMGVTGVTGAYPVDLNSDGMLDLVILRAGRNLVFQGNPNCAFTAVSDLLPDLGERWTTAFSATWEADKTRPTLAFGHYVDRSNPEGPFEACDINHLLRPDGDAYEVIDLAPGFCPLSMLFSDWGRQGRAELRVSNDRHYYVSEGAEQMWAMEPVPRLLTDADGWRAHKLWGMGIAARDVTGDGLPEVYLSSMGDQRMQMLQDANTPTYDDVPFGMGTTTHRPPFGGDGRPSTGWHTAFGDVTNDGLDDIFVAKGNVDQMPGLAMEDPNALLEQVERGRWAEVTEAAGLASFHRGRGATVTDLNGDGLLDIAVVNRRAPLEVWQNISVSDGHWVKIALQQDSGNRFGIGAWIEVKVGDRVHAREVTIGGGHAGGSAVPEHFGLGAIDTAKVRVIWPDGHITDWRDIALDQTVTLRR